MSEAGRQRPDGIMSLSGDLAARAMALTPGGSQTLSKQAGRFPGATPRFLERGDGAYVWTPEGDRLIDWVCALGAVSLGYNHPAVTEAVVDRARNGAIFSLPHRLEGEVAQRLVDLIPCAESVRFVKTGSEACEAAVRVARAATGRDIVLTCGYHGWHSWYAATREEHPGVPEAMTWLVDTFQYNDLRSLDKAIDFAKKRKYGPEERQKSYGVAAIIMEPTLIEPPAPGFLAGVRERATRLGAVLIFDEMVTGFRWHAGGAQALYGVTPDLACFGKGMGNGYPIAALVGRADLMRHARLVSGTFGGDCIGLAAADATLARYQSQHYWATPECECGRDVCGAVRHDSVTAHMWKLGAQLIAGYNALATTLGAPTRMIGQPPHPVIRWDEEDDPLASSIASVRRPTPRYRASLFFQETVRRGVLFHSEGINIMLAHTEVDVATTLEVCEAGMIAVMAAIKGGLVREWIQGEPIDPVPAWRVAR